MHLHPYESALLADLRTRELFARVQRERMANEAGGGRLTRPRAGGWRRRVAALAASVVGWLEPSGPPVRREVAPRADAPSVLRAAAGPVGRHGRW